MADPVPRATVEQLARQVVAQVSPAELPMFRATADAYFADPERATSARGRPDEPLGFGVEAAVALVGPFALDLVRRVLGSLAERMGDALAEAVARRLQRPQAQAGAAPAAPAGPRDPEPLDAAQLGLVRRVAQEEAARLRLPGEQAQRLADALVASIATQG